MQNYFLGAGNSIYVRPIEAAFHNSLFYGPLGQEFNLDTLDSGGFDQITFDHCLIGNATEQNTGAFQDTRWNLNPGFISNTNLRPTSVNVNFGSDGFPTSTGADIDFQPWITPINSEDGTGPSVGCYQKQ